MKSTENHLDEQFMSRALELALLGRGHVSPNPMVGCVVVCEGKIIGEGWHRKYGEGHAEVNAVNSVGDKNLLKESTVYVTLEPCSHFGKTPPCADLLIHHKLRRVVVCNVDSNPLVAGTGIRKLREAGVEVTTGVLEARGRELNQRFFTFMEKQRPYIILKWAQTADGFIARENFDSKWISDEFSRQLVHRWRSEEDAILVGARTALHDNPHLNVRDWTGSDPVRIVIDGKLSVPRSHRLFDGSQKTICYNFQKQEDEGNISFVRLEKGNNEISQIVTDLYSRKIQSVIIEGGSQTITKFIESQLWDEARVFSSDTTFQSGIPAPVFQFKHREEHKLKSDWLKVYRP